MQFKLGSTLTGRGLDLVPNANGRARQYHKSHRTKVKFNSVCYSNLGGGVSTWQGSPVPSLPWLQLQRLLELQQSDGARRATWSLRSTLNFPWFLTWSEPPSSEWDNTRPPEPPRCLVRSAGFGRGRHSSHFPQFSSNFPQFSWHARAG